jgi:hypothetical protein
MTRTILFISTVFLIFSCSNTTGEENNVSLNNPQPKSAEYIDTIPKMALQIDRNEIKNSENESNEILPNGKYRFDIAFAEWEGKSMGEKVTVVIDGDLIKVIYEGDGKLTLTKKGEILDQGKIMKHKSGVWIIGNTSTDIQLDEIGGCTGGPAIIDFKNKKFWMC